MGKKSKLKKACGIFLAAALIGGSAFAVVRIFRPARPVFAYGFADGIAGQLGTAETEQSDGFVTAEGIQPIFLSDSQTVLETKVKEGERVQKGQVLFTYDTTLSALALDQKRLSVERSKMDLENLKRELSRIQNYVPIPEQPAETVPKGPDPYEALRKADLNGKQWFLYGESGLSPQSPRYCWLRSDEMVNQNLMRELCQQMPVVYVVFQMTEEDRADGEIVGEYGMRLVRAAWESPSPSEPVESQPAEPAESEPVTESSLPESAEIQTGPSESQMPELTESQPVSPMEPSAPEEKPQPAEPEIMYSFYDPRTSVQEELPELPENSGYTIQEIRQMQTEKQKQIKDMETAIHIAESEYKVMELEASSGEVLAKTDGVIMNLISPETARKEHKAFMRVSDGGGFYVRGVVTEGNMGTVHSGQEVEISAPQTGGIYSGTIVRVLDIPEPGEQNSYDEGIPESRYPYQVFVSQDADLREGMYVTVEPVHTESRESLYIRDAFVHKEKGQAYAFVRNPDGNLRKQELTLGPGRLDDSQQVLEGITEADFLALPFAKGVRAGAPAQTGSWETLD